MEEEDKNRGLSEWTSSQKPKDYLLPASIVTAALLVSGALVYSAGKSVSGEASAEKASIAGTAERVIRPTQVSLTPVGEKDHVRGERAAEVVVVEYSDLECPYCKQFHNTMKTVVETYGDRVAWVYRHLPIVSLHSKALKEAEASECAEELGGKDAFWKYIDRIFEITPSNNGLDSELLPMIGEAMGMPRTEFEACLSSGRHKARVDEDIKSAEETGARGTPFSVVVNKKGEQFVIPGALPFEKRNPDEVGIKDIIERALQ